MTKPTEGQLRTITILDEDSGGQVTFTGADGVDIGSTIFEARVSQPTTGAGTGALWVEQGTPTLIKYTDSAGTTIDLGAQSVSNVFGRTGAITATSGDYNSDQITNSSTITGSTVSDALEELESQISGAGLVSSVFGRTGNVVAVSGDYNSDLVTNSSTVVGATVSDALESLDSAISAIPSAPVDSVFGRTGAVVATYGDYNSDQLINASAVTGVTVSDALEQVQNHGNLSGLTDDDHTQYLLISGTRAMTGDLNMSTNEVINVSRLENSSGNLTTSSINTTVTATNGLLLSAISSLNINTASGDVVVSASDNTDISSGTNTNIGASNIINIDADDSISMTTGSSGISMTAETAFSASSLSSTMTLTSSGIFSIESTSQRIDLTGNGINLDSNNQISVTFDSTHISSTVGTTDGLTNRTDLSYRN